jgi:hypothetical protein
VVWKLEGNRPLGRPKYRWEAILQWVFKKWDETRDMDWMDLSQDMNGWRKVVNAPMIIRFPNNAGNFLSSRGPVSFSRRIILYGVC